MNLYTVCTVWCTLDESPSIYITLIQASVDKVILLCVHECDFKRSSILVIFSFAHIIYSQWSQYAHAHIQAQFIFNGALIGTLQQIFHLKII